MSLNKNDFMLLEDINKEEYSLDSLAQKYATTKRNIRYLIENINFYLQKDKLPTVEIKKGRVLFEVEIKSLELWRDTFPESDYSFHQEERENFILVQYLFKENVKIQQIADFLKVSRTTIKTDIKHLEVLLSQFELYFSREENKLEIIGNEKKLRHLKLLKILEYIEIQKGEIVFLPKKYLGEKEEKQQIQIYIEEYFQSEILQVIQSIENKLEIRFSEAFLNIILPYLVITLERIQKGYIISRKNNSEFLRKLSDYRIIKEELAVLLPEKYEFEILHLTEYFLSGYSNQDFSENILMVESFISHMLLWVGESLQEELLQDGDLIQKLFEYLLPTIYRIKNNVYLYKNLNFENIDTHILEVVNRYMSENEKNLKEGLRKEEIFAIAEMIQKSLEVKNIKKISMKKLMEIFQKYNKREEDSKEFYFDLKEAFGEEIQDDFYSFGEKENSLLLHEKRVCILKKKVSFEEAIDIGTKPLLEEMCMKEEMISQLKELSLKFGKYMFLREDVLLCHRNQHSEDINSSVAIVLSAEGIEVEKNLLGKLLFIVSSRNILEHLKVVTEIIKIVEDQTKFQQILKAKSTKEIIDFFETINS